MVSSAIIVMETRKRRINTVSLLRGEIDLKSKSKVNVTAIVIILSVYIVTSCVDI